MAIRKSSARRLFKLCKAIEAKNPPTDHQKLYMVKRNPRTLIGASSAM